MPDRPLAGLSYWMDTAPGPEYPRLETGVKVDVAVVGAGIAGICTAWQLGRTGRQVALIEADRLAAGVTGYTTAKLTAAHSRIYSRLRNVDAEHARLYAVSQMEALHQVRQSGIDCEFELCDAYTCTEDPARVPDLQAEAEAAREAGLAATFESEPPLGFAGAVRITGQAQFHPRRYLLSLAQDFVSQGGRIFERTRVTKLDEGRVHRLITADGVTVEAEHVVVATHFPIFDRALLFPRLTPRREVVVAAPLAAHLDPGGMFVTIEDDFRSVRTAPLGVGHRLLIVTGGPFTPGTESVTAKFDDAENWMRKRFKAEPTTYRWAAQDNRSSDGLPFVGPLRPGARNVWVATGFSGWGMTNGIMSGGLITSLIEGRPLPWARLYDPRRLHPVREAGRVFDSAVRSARHTILDRLRADSATAEGLSPGEGAVIARGGRRCAVYRDDSGALHAVSAVCTHMGCIVGFNDAERTWECPCHGSRFGVDGEVLQGPAVHPLSKVELE